MEQQSHEMERRRNRRIAIEAPLRVRPAAGAGHEGKREGVTRDLGLAGVYFEVDDPSHFRIDEILAISVTVPESAVSQFPFTLLSGRGRVVRVEQVVPVEHGRTRIGVALEFEEEITALSAIANA